jgi:hypothetical protein
METKWNEKEKKVLKAFPLDEPIHISELAKKAFPSMGAKSTTKGNSWVRNSIRRPIQMKLVKQLARGLYLRLWTGPEKRSKKSKTNFRARLAKKTPTRNATPVATATSTSSAVVE